MGMTAEKDIVLIYFEDKPLTFARIEEIAADYKPGWFHVRLLMLQVPVQVVTWILRDAYIDGAEFTMNGKRIRLERIDAAKAAGAAAPEPPAPPSSREPAAPAKVISLTELKKGK